MNEETKLEFSLSTLLNPKRVDGESYTNYADRRRLGNKFLGIIKKGNLVWDSSKVGTYIKPKENK